MKFGWPGAAAGGGAASSNAPGAGDTTAAASCGPGTRALLHAEATPVSTVGRVYGVDGCGQGSPRPPQID